jgi:hypothetical protein
VNQWSVRNISTGTPVLRRGEEEVGGWRISLCCDREADCSRRVTPSYGGDGDPVSVEVLGASDTGLVGVDGLVLELG